LGDSKGERFHAETLRVRLPRHQIAMLEYRAEQDETTVSGVLERELDGIASAHSDELSEALPEFAAAMEWPDGFYGETVSRGGAETWRC